MFDAIGSFFGGLASKAKTKIIETTLQPFIDYHLENIFEQKILIQNLNKGVSNVSLNVNYLNQVLKTNVIRAVIIKTIKLEKLQLSIKDFHIVMDLNIPTEEAVVIKSIEIQDFLQQSIHMQMEDLKKEFLNSQNRNLISSAETKEPSKENKTSSFTVKALRFIDCVFGNIKVDIQNLQIEIQGQSVNKTQANFMISINSIKAQLQKMPNSNQIYMNGSIGQVRMFLSASEQIAQLNEALQLEIYLIENQEPKISVKISQLSIITTLEQLSTLKQLFNQSSQLLEERETIIKEAIRKSNNRQTFNYQINKDQQVELNKFRISSYFGKNITETQNIIEDYEESTIIFEYNLSSPLISEFKKTVKNIAEQKEFLNIQFQGVRIYIPDILQPVNFNTLKSQNEFQIELENHYTLDVANLIILKNQTRFSIIANSIYLYQILQVSEKFHSLNEQCIISSTDFYRVQKRSFLCRSLIKIGTYQVGPQIFTKSTANIILQEPEALRGNYTNANALTLILEEGNLSLNLTPFNIVLNQEQLQFLLQLCRILGEGQNCTQFKKKKLSPAPESNTKLSLSLQKTNFSIFYYRPISQLLLNSSTCNQSCEYEQFNFLNFFIQTPQTQTLNKIKFEFGFSEILEVKSLIRICNVKCEFSINLLTQKNVSISFKDGKETINQYRKRSQEKQENQLIIQIDTVSINHSNFNNFYKMIQEICFAINSFNNNNNNQQPVTQSNFYFAVKINTIELTLYETLLFNIYKFKYYFVIDNQFILIKDFNAFYLKTSQLLINNQIQENLIFCMKMNQNTLSLEFAPFKISLNNFDFSELTSCIQKLMISLSYLNQPQDNDQLNQPKKVNLTLKQIMIDILPTYNEEVILQKRNLSKLHYNKQLYPSWTRSILVINHIQNSLNQTTVLEILIYFKNNNKNENNQNIVELSDFVKIGCVHKLLFQNKILSIDSIQLFQFTKQLFIDLVDHFQHISKDKKKVPLQDLEINQYQKVDSISFSNPSFVINCNQITLANKKSNLEVFLYMLQFSLGEKSCQLKIGRISVFDKIEKSKFLYLLDEEDVCGIDGVQSQIFQESPFLDSIVHFETKSIVASLKIKPMRICLSGYQLQQLSESFNSKVIQPDVFIKIEEDDQQLFEIINQTSAFNLQVELDPILIIISYDSEGLEVENLKQQFLKFGSFNNLILSTNQKIEFYQNNSTSKQDFVKYLINQQISTFGILFQAYNTLEITKIASSFTNGIINMFSKPFISGNGFFYGLIEGTYDFTCGVTSSLLQLTSMPTNAINNVASFIGLGKISAPLQQIDDFCKKLYFQINPAEGIPARFYKNQQ